MTHNHETAETNAADLADRLNRAASEWRERAENAERERDVAIADAREIATTNLHANAAYEGARDAAAMLRTEIAELRALVARAVEAVAPFAEFARVVKCPEQQAIYAINDKFLFAKDFFLAAALAAELRKAGEGV
jgi:hypothetical protein